MGGQLSQNQNFEPRGNCVTQNHNLKYENLNHQKNPQLQSIFQGTSAS